MLDNYKKFVRNPFDEKKRIAQEIDRLNAKLSVARNKLLLETIDDEDYLDIKKECKEQIESLEEEITGIEWEPWHFRYIGAEHAQVLRDSGLCLEEYIEQLQGTTPLS